jgi:butyryl-CoA dehydrogenase
MAQYTNMENVKFLLHEVHQLSELFQHGRYQDYDKESVDILLDSTKDLADKEYFPHFREMDEQPASFKDGRITVHPSLDAMIKGYANLGLIGGPFDYDDGGLQLPGMVMSACNHILECANNHAIGYAGLTTGTANLILSFGSEELKQTYVPKMLTAEWTGTMCLTEPQAGSSLSDVTTSASPLRDGSYAIKGQKIFISGGDQQFAENIIHLVLARIDGAPVGTKGISLFVVPNSRPLPNGGGFEDNDVIVAGEFQKMGQRGYATAHLAFGENGDCRGYLVGQPHQGLRYMFQMMNEARIEVGITANSIATAAYHASLQYANERPQGRRINNAGKKNLSEGQALIINHPDVRRMLLLQKAVTEASLSLIFEASKAHDMNKVSEGEQAAHYHLLLELLTPVVKTYPSEMGRISVNNGLQVLGGYGFCSDFVLQQYYRDIRICAIYEGTTGIQSLDLLGRKVTMKNGQALQILLGEMQQTIQAAMVHQDLKPYAKALTAKLGLTQKVLGHLMPFAMKGEYERYLMDANLFMEFASTLIIGWQWLKIATVAKQTLLTGQLTYSEAFYESKIDTMRFYYKYEMPKTLGLAESLMDDTILTIVEEKEVVF